MFTKIIWLESHRFHQNPGGHGKLQAPPVVLTVFKEKQVEKDPACLGKGALPVTGGPDPVVGVV